MSETVSSTETSTGFDLADWQAGTLAGTLAGVVMGVMLTTQLTPVIEAAIPAMYGLSGGLAGWVVHVSHGAVLGVAFAAVLGAVGGGEWSTAKTVGVGLAFGVALWVVLAVLVMPVWLQTVGFGPAPAVPNVSPKSLVGHVVYGVVLGGAFAVLD
ncbi:DUF1440 domain-containing protein [Halorubellus salinus]|uniref:DUF1440 domain-containing protein n=1 Tax=Halorubellus salinus TaxID=755309 RepID=UPI001D097831|nr:DUF1440 domain-containing protein [Halorubellus salinus]